MTRTLTTLILLTMALVSAPAFGLDCRDVRTLAEADLPPSLIGEILDEAGLPRDGLQCLQRAGIRPEVVGLDAAARVESPLEQARVQSCLDMASYNERGRRIQLPLSQECQGTLMVLEYRRWASTPPGE